MPVPGSPPASGRPWPATKTGASPASILWRCRHEWTRMANSQKERRAVSRGSFNQIRLRIWSLRWWQMHLAPFDTLKRL